MLKTMSYHSDNTCYFFYASSPLFCFRILVCGISFITQISILINKLMDSALQ